jgi:hypothetical protein
MSANLNAEKASEKTFGYNDGLFINVYTEENPILEVNDECYFLFNSLDNYHRPIIGKGKVLHDSFTDGLHKTYYIALKEICETEMVLNAHVWKKQYLLVADTNLESVKKIPRVHYIYAFTKQEFLDENLFKVDCFFVRKSKEQAENLRKEYVKVILEQTKEMISEMEEIINS